MIKVLLRRVTRFYEVRTQRMSGADGAPSGPPLTVSWAYSPHGHFVGDERMAKRLAKYGIVPELAAPDRRVCSVGYSTKDGKWYGWSHRAIFGFKIGDRVYDGSFGNEKTPFVRHGKRTIKSFADAREAACAFAKSVS